MSIATDEAEKKYPAPTDNDVKADYVRAFCSARNTKNWSENSVKGERAFNSWLAAHDAQIRAESWDEGHERGWMDGVENAEPASPNPYRKENYLYKSNGLQSEEQQ